MAVGGNDRGQGALSLVGRSGRGDGPYAVGIGVTGTSRDDHTGAPARRAGDLVAICGVKRASLAGT
jgi:hypothetical protein